VAPLRVPEVREVGEMEIWGKSKKQVNYRPAPTPEVRCDHCKFMFPRLSVGGCRLVRGNIRSSDTCEAFTPRGAEGGAEASEGDL